MNEKTNNVSYFIVITSLKATEINMIDTETKNRTKTNKKRFANQLPTRLSLPRPNQHFKLPG